MKKISLLTFCLLCSFDLFAQILTPVKWSYAAKKTSATTAVIFIKATIDDSWHIYSINQKDGGPVKTSFTFLPTAEYSLVGDVTEPTPHKEFDKTFSMEVLYFEKSVVFQQKVKLIKSSTTVNANVNFMVCNNQKCLPPDDVKLSIPIK